MSRQVCQCDAGKDVWTDERTEVSAGGLPEPLSPRVCLDFSQVFPLQYLCLDDVVFE